MFYADVQELNEIAQNIEMQSSESTDAQKEEQQQQESKLHAPPQNEGDAPPVPSEQSHEFNTNESPTNVPKSEDEQQPKIEQGSNNMATEQNGDDNDQIMADSQQPNDAQIESQEVIMKEEQNQISQPEPTQTQEIKQQIPEPMDTDDAPAQNDRIQTVEKDQVLSFVLL